MTAIARYQHLFGTVIAGFFSDEPPIGNTPGYTPNDCIGRPDMALPWSAAMPQHMQAEYGAGWETALTLLWANGTNNQQTAHIRTAYMNAVSKLVSTCFSEQIGTWCAQRGVEYIGHMLEDCDANANLGPSMGHFFRGLSGQHMAGIDNIGGQVVIGGQNAVRRKTGLGPDDAGFYHYTLGRLGASMAAIDPRKQGRCLCENFGAYGWQVGTRTEKYLVDHFLVRGVNRHVPHAFSPKAFPDPDCPPHFYAHGENPQARAFGHLMQYTNRLSHLIDGGQCHAPVALLYHGESRWAGAYESNIAACRALTQSQIGFVIFPADVFTHPAQFHMEADPTQRRFCLNGIECSALVICGCDYLPQVAAEFAARMAQGGFPVVFTSNLPKGVSELPAHESAPLLQQLAACAVTPAKQLPLTLLPFLAPDVTLEAPFPNLTVYRYRNKETLYLLLNEDPAVPFSGKVHFAETASVVQYDAWNNTLWQPVVMSQKSGCTIDVTLEPLATCALVFGDNLPVAQALPTYGAASRVIPVTNFSVRRCEATQYPDFDETQMPHQIGGMQHLHPEFSGYYQYTATVGLPQHNQACLEIANVYESAEVFVNEQSAGMLTAPPYHFAIGAFTHKGENRIVIEVATTLERKAAAMSADVACMNIPAPLSPTGIVGDVAIRLL